jgi:asparagine synthase (glutamine-hydrolysing)
MTLIAGIVSRKLGVPVPAAACASLQEMISRDPQDKITTIEKPGAFFAKLDIGAFGEPAVVNDSDGAVTLLAGEPLLRAGDGRRSDTDTIHRAFLDGDVDPLLATATGVFSAIHFDPSNGGLTLVTDKLGIRPVYYWAGDEYVVFAGALRILEELAEVPKVMDVRTVTEIVGLGYALADRTPYADIKMLRPAERVSFADGNISRETYWRWDEIGKATVSEGDLLSALYRRFETAVARRNRSDTATSAYLSGGLDSRCIVAALREQGVEAHTYNFARPKTQDLIFGREFAREAGAIHQEIPKPAGDMVPDYSQLMASAIAGSKNKQHLPERPSLVWSGEGGSVALGHVHLSEEMVEWMRAGEIDRVITEYIRRESAAVAPKLFTAAAAQALSGILEDGIRGELGKLKSPDPARNFYLYLLLNDQHRKLARHFEDLDLHRLEFQVPFFDSDFLEAIVAIPIDICLRHRLYIKWLSLFPPAVTAVPWQAYPGHQTCPVPVSEELAYQWADTFQAAERSTRQRREADLAGEMLGSTDFPGEILNRRNLRLAALIHRSGLRNYQYLLGPAATYHSFWQKCGGRYVLP